MIARHRPLLAILAIASVIHLVGMIRSPIPSQDGLKFIRIAREFGRQPWLDVVRSADQHPLYPILIAAGQPVVSAVLGDGPPSWRIAAQGVSILATLAMIPCFFIFSSVLVDRRSALLATLLLVLLPTTSRLGHETLSDATALSFAVASLALGCLALTTGRPLPAVGSGLLAGLGFLARPEVAVIPLAVAAGWTLHRFLSLARSIRTFAETRTRTIFASSTDRAHPADRSTTRRVIIHTASGATRTSDQGTPARLPSVPHARRTLRRRALTSTVSSQGVAATIAENADNFPAPREMQHASPSPLLRVSATLREILLLPVLFLVPLLLIVCSYSAIKGSISEKLSVRFATGLGEGTGLARSAPPWMPPGLDDPRWDFSPKEEAGAPGRLGFAGASLLVLRQMIEATAWVLIPLALLGAWKHKPNLRSRPAFLATGLLAVGFAAILIRHAMRAGYLSDRHCLVLVVAVLPFAARGVFLVAKAIADRRNLSPSRRRAITFALLATVVIAGFAPQLKAGHPSRWGHQQAGRWIADRAAPGEAMLDTRGWAAFAADIRSYGPWHIGQAITDEKLGYIVIGDDELTAGTRRAETFAAILDHAAELVAAFPEREGGDRVGVWVFRYTRPESWEGINR